MDNGAPVSGLVVQVYVTSLSKNPYPLEPYLTGEDGVVAVRSVDISKAIRIAQQDFPMDYNGSIQDCENAIFVIANRDTLERQAIGIEEWDHERGMSFIEMISCSVNDIIIPCEITFPLDTLDGRIINVIRSTGRPRSGTLPAG